MSTRKNLLQKYPALREVDDYEALAGNSPAMLETAAAGFCKFFEAVPFVSHAGIFSVFGHDEEKCGECLNLAVFLHNPPVLERKPGPYWYPIAEWTFHSDYEISELFGNSFLDKLGEYSGELPLTSAPALSVFIFDELVISDPEYRKREWRLWKSRKFIKHIFQTLRLHDKQTNQFKKNPIWEKAVFDSRQYNWVMRENALVPTIRKPGFVGADSFPFKEYHNPGHKVSARSWEKVGLLNVKSAIQQGFEECEKCFGKKSATK